MDTEHYRKNEILCIYTTRRQKMINAYYIQTILPFLHRIIISSLVRPRFLKIPFAKFGKKSEVFIKGELFFMFVS